MSHGPASGRDLARAVLRSSPVILGITALTFYLAQAGWLHGFETGAIDAMLRLKAPQRIDDVVIVAITDGDYAESFGSTSPLDTAKVGEIVTAILDGHPKVLAVDLDTSSDAYDSFVVPSGSPVVWAQDAILDPETRQFIPGPVLGGRAPAPPSGIAVFPLDGDGLVRHYRPEFATAAGSKPSLPEAVIRLARANAHHATPGAHHGTAHHGAAHHDLVLNFAGDRFAFPRLSVRDLLAASKGPAWGKSGPLTGKIVVLGGGYRAARDEYPTPLGKMAGAEVVAHAIAAELHGGGVRLMNEILMVLLEVLSGVLLVVMHHKLALRPALVASLFALPLFALASSWIAFSTFALWANFVPLLVGVLIHQLYDHAREYQRLLAATAR